MASPYPPEPADILHQNQNSDTADGFRKCLQEKFAKLSCTGTEFSKKRTEKSSDELSSRESLNATGNMKKQKLPPIEFDWDNNEYDFSHPKRGLAIIINNQSFRKCSFLKDRLGSDKDAAVLSNSLRSLDFDVEEYNNLEAWKMVEVLEAATKYYDHEASDCFVCAVLTHGNEAVANPVENPSEEKAHLDLLFGIDGIAVTVKYLVETFNDIFCPALKDKPRIFFLQTCRGKKCDDGQIMLVAKDTEPLNPLHPCRGDDQDLKNKDLAVNLQEESFSSNDKPMQNCALDERDVLEDADDDVNENASDKVENSEGNSKQPAGKRDALWNPINDPLPRPAPSYNDFLIMYAAPPGHTAWRNKEDGSWFIQTLCSVLDGVDLTSTSLLRALTKVNGRIARDFESQNDEFPEKKGLPVIESKLIKDIFIPRKTRGTAADILN